MPSFIAKSEEILAKWRQEGGLVEGIYSRNGIEPIERLMREMPDDQELEKLLYKQIEQIKYEDEKLRKVYNEEWWVYQIAAMRALREEAKRVWQIHGLPCRSGSLLFG